MPEDQIERLSNAGEYDWDEGGGGCYYGEHRSLSEEGEDYQDDVDDERAEELRSLVNEKEETRRPSPIPIPEDMRDGQGQQRLDFGDWNDRTVAEDLSLIHI